MSKVSTHTALLYIREPEVFDGDLPKLIREAAPQIRRMRELGLLSFKEDRDDSQVTDNDTDISPGERLP